MRKKKDDEIQLFRRSVSQLPRAQKYVREYFCELLGSIILSAETRSQRCHKGEFRRINISTRQYNVDRIFVGFPESYTADDSWIVRSSGGGQREDKRAHNSTTKVSFCTIIIRFVTA